MARPDSTPPPAGLYTSADRQRWVPEPGKNQERTEFARDRARIVHSAALRRLGAKTQVLAPGLSDFGRTRLTHSLEVAQVGRELGQALGCDPDVVDTACLAHDLGHPPFGHNGESALDRVAGPAGGFEANAQTLRLLTRLEPKVFAEGGRSVGLNLTRASLDAATKYPWARGADPHGLSSRKFGYYPDDEPAFAWVRQGAPSAARCVEAQVMDLADDVSYSVHDVEDAIESGRIDPAVFRDEVQQQAIVQCAQQWYRPTMPTDDLEAALERLVGLPYWVSGFDGSRPDLARLKDMTSQLIGRFVTQVETATRARFGAEPLTRYAADVIAPDATLAEIAILKGAAAWYVMVPRENDPAHQAERRALRDLVEALALGGPDLLEPPFASDWHAAGSESQRLRVVVDQVASLTDVSAWEWHARICAVDV